MRELPAQVISVTCHRLKPHPPRLQPERPFHLTAFALLHNLPSMDYEAKLGIHSQFVPHYPLTGKPLLTDNSWARV